MFLKDMRFFTYLNTNAMMMYINRNDNGRLMTKHDASKCYKVLSNSLYPYDYDIFISRNQNR